MRTLLPATYVQARTQGGACFRLRLRTYVLVLVNDDFYDYVCTRTQNLVFSVLSMRMTTYAVGYNTYERSGTHIKIPIVRKG